MSFWRSIVWLFAVVHLYAGIGMWCGTFHLFHMVVSWLWLLFVALPVAILR